MLSLLVRVIYKLRSGIEHWAAVGRIGRFFAHGHRWMFVTAGMRVGRAEVGLGVGRGLTAGTEPCVSRLRLGAILRGSSA